MRVVSWNLNRATWSNRGRIANADEHQRRAWEELGGLGCGVALVQEAPPPVTGLSRPPTGTVPAGTDRDDWRTEPGPQRRWCTAVASWGPQLTPLDDSGREPLHVSHSGAYALARVPWNGRHLVLASVYALWDYSWVAKGGKARYTETSMHRVISDLTPILDVAQSKESVLLGGDLNASTQHAPPYRAAYRLVHERLLALGLHNVSVRAEGAVLDGCPCADEPCRHVRTLDSPTPYQNDYFYASPDVAEAIRSFSVACTTSLAAVSDHTPLVIDLG